MKTTKNPFSEEAVDFKARTAYMALGVLFLFLLLVTRLWYLQVIKGSEFRVLSENNRTRLQYILPPRGLLLDRYGRILVDNHPSFDLAVVREHVPDLNYLSRRLSDVLNLPLSEMEKSFEAVRSRPSFKAVPIRTDLSRQELVSLETYRFELPGLDIQIKPRRKYLYGSLAAHVIGYLGEISPAQLKLKKYDNYRMRDLVGKFGLEKEFEFSLTGKRGWRVAEVDAAGRVLNIVKQVPPVPGNNLYLTLDARLQGVAEAALKGMAGSIVAMVPSTGEILVMVSSPSYLQQDFVGGISADKWRALKDNPLHPLENRAISGQYMPGSTFKIVSALAGLEEGIIKPEDTVFCNGSYTLGNRTFKCWKKSGHGTVNLYKALVESCDVYFYDLGSRLPIDRLAYYSKLLGLGAPTGIGLANEKGGLVATTKWKRDRFGEDWYTGESLSVIIGQGYNLATPLQMARMVSTVVNGGKLMQPYLASRITDSKNKPLKSFSPRMLAKLDVNPKTLEIIKNALVGVVNSPRGTGKRARMKSVLVGGKTGTSQVVSGKVVEGDKEIPYKYRDDAWFVSFAPAENPEIVVVVIAEHMGHGGSAAAPLAKKVLQAYFQKQTQDEVSASFRHNTRLNEELQP